jgi:hypothetical protein
MNAAYDYQRTFTAFQEEKAGMSTGGGMMIMMRTSNEEEEEPEPIDLAEVPRFTYAPPRLSDALDGVVVNIGLLVLFNLVFFTAAFAAFTRYDVR